MTPATGAAAAAVAIIGGEVTLGFPNIPPALPHVKSGRLRALAVTTARRSAAVPELPTVAEAGLPGYEATAWYGILAPAGTPPEIIARLNADVVRAVRTQEVRERIAAEGGEAMPTTPEGFTALMKDHIGRWAKVVKASGARAD